MLILEARPSIALDESAHGFISTFMSHVATVSGYGTNRITSITHIKTLLLAAIARGDGASGGAWATLHHAIVELLSTAGTADDTGSARVYLQSFVEENRDLASD